VPLLGTTATANDRVVADIAAQLGDDLSVVRGPLGRASLRLQTVDLPSQAERLAWMADVLPSLPGSGIVYCLTTRDCETVGRWLRSRGLRVAHYHSKMSPEERPALEEALRRNEVKALVATVALGMGFDKPDVGFVVHFQKPGSAIAYYQQIGRAGRSLSDAVVVLLHGAEDDAILDYFIDGAFPPEQALREVLGALESSEDGLTVGAIERPVNLPRGRIEQCLKVLEADGAVFKDGPRYERTANPWTLDRTRIEGVTDQRRRERQRMTDFTGGRTCLMEFLQGELDDPSASPCGRCAVCAGSIVAQHPAPAVVAAAADFLHGAHQRVLDPRKQWPAGIVGVGARAIPPALRAEAGHVLSVYRDAGWGRLVHDGKHRDHRFDDGLVEAAALAVLDSWTPDPPPQWVTAVPSISSPVVPEFARRLAVRLGLPFRAALTKVKEAPPQKTMENSYRQARNAIDAFRADGSQVSDAPVLLVDDLVDSRWTLAACAAALREAGSGPVHPLALADSSRGAS
jgi:ATP-dependent DNA helicase RecQ